MRVVTFSVQLRAYLLATGDYVSAMPKSMLRLNPECKGLKALPIRLPQANFPVAILTLKARTLRRRPRCSSTGSARMSRHWSDALPDLTPPARPRSGRASRHLRPRLVEVGDQLLEAGRIGRPRSVAMSANW